MHKSRFWILNLLSIRSIKTFYFDTTESGLHNNVFNDVYFIDKEQDDGYQFFIILKIHNKAIIT